MTPTEMNLDPAAFDSMEEEEEDLQFEEEKEGVEIKLTVCYHFAISQDFRKLTATFCHAD